MVYSNKWPSIVLHQDTDIVPISPHSLPPTPLLTLRLKSLSTLDPPPQLNILIYAMLGPNPAAEGHRSKLQKHLELRRHAAVYARRWGEPLGEAFKGSVEETGAEVFTGET